MQRQREKKDTVSSKSKSQELDRFTPLLADIRSGLGNHWTFYEECIDGVLDAAANQQSTTAWMEQMQQIVEGNDKVTFSHEGVLFLLRDMGIQPPKQQSWGEGEGNTFGMYPSPPLSPPEESREPNSPSTNNMVPLSVRPHITMASLLPHRPLRPNAPAITDWVAPRAVLPRNQQRQRQKQQPPNLFDGVLPFDFNAPRQPGLTLPKDLKAFHYPPEQIIMTKNYVAPPSNPLGENSSNPVLFTDPALREGVAELFSCMVRSEDSNRNGNSNTWQARQTLPYNPNDDDLMVWKKRLGGQDGQAWSDEVKANGSVNDTWPPWNFRFDLNL